MPTYSTEDFEKIAETIGKGPAHVIQYANRFEAAAAWYRLYCRAPKGLHPADTGKRMRQIANAAHKLLRQLEVYDYRKAPDGPADVTLLEFLASAENGSEDGIIQATAQIGRLAEIFAAIDAAQELEAPRPQSCERCRSAKSADQYQRPSGRLCCERLARRDDVNLQSANPEGSANFDCRQWAKSGQTKWTVFPVPRGGARAG